MTINDLIAELQRRAAIHGGDRDVQVTWEGAYRDIELLSVYLDRVGVLLIDADGCAYKRQFQHPNDAINDLPGAGH